MFTAADFTSRVIADLGAALAAGAVVLGDRLGLYRALLAGPMRPLELARRTGTAPRYVEEWLRGQVASGYVQYEPGADEYFLTPEQAHTFADPAGFRLVLGALAAQVRLEEAFRSGVGIARSEHSCAALYGSDHAADIVSTWLPALRGVTARLRRGGRVADLGSGDAATAVAMARAFRRSTFVTIVTHDDAAKRARRRVAEAGLADRITVEQGCAQSFEGGPYDLVTVVDGLHELGDPVGAARNVAAQLAPDGVWMIVEPVAGASVTENLTPVGRLYYSLSLYLCVPGALAQEGGYSLGAQAGEEPLRRIAHAAGFGRFRTASRDALTAVYEARH